MSYSDSIQSCTGIQIFDLSPLAFADQGGDLFQVYLGHHWLTFVEGMPHAREFARRILAECDRREALSTREAIAETVNLNDPRD